MESTSPRIEPAPSPATLEPYSVNDVCRILGLSNRELAALMKAGSVDGSESAGGEAGFSFRDLVLLRTARDLTKRLPRARIHRALRNLRQQLPRERALSDVRLSANGRALAARDGESAWDPESGQVLLPWEEATENTPASNVSSLLVPPPQLAQTDKVGGSDTAQSENNEETAEAWYAAGYQREETDIEEAREAYRRALELNPLHIDARINLGRLLHQLGAHDAAERHYRLTLEIDPKNGLAAFNLGVVLEEVQRPDEAVQFYLTALEYDPALADAHFNLARVFEQLELPQRALRHWQAYNHLTRDER